MVNSFIFPLKTIWLKCCFNLHSLISHNFYHLKYHSKLHQYFACQLTSIRQISRPLTRPAFANAGFMITLFGFVAVVPQAAFSTNEIRLKNQMKINSKFDFKSRQILYLRATKISLSFVFIFILSVATL